MTWGGIPTQPKRWGPSPPRRSYDLDAAPDPRQRVLPVCPGDRRLKPDRPHKPAFTQNQFRDDSSREVVAINEPLYPRRSCYGGRPGGHAEPSDAASVGLIAKRFGLADRRERDLDDGAPLRASGKRVNDYAISGSVFCLGSAIRREPTLGGEHWLREWRSE